jgi:hypothetical protein
MGQGIVGECCPIGYEQHFQKETYEPNEQKKTRIKKKPDDEEQTEAVLDCVLACSPFP